MEDRRQHSAVAISNAHQAQQIEEKESRGFQQHAIPQEMYREQPGTLEPAYNKYQVGGKSTWGVQTDTTGQGRAQEERSNE